MSIMITRKLAVLALAVLACSVQPVYAVEKYAIFDDADAIIIGELNIRFVWPTLNGFSYRGYLEVSNLIYNNNAISDSKVEVLYRCTCCRWGSMFELARATEGVFIWFLKKSQTGHMWEISGQTCSDPGCRPIGFFHEIRSRAVGSEAQKKFRDFVDHSQKMRDPD